MSAGARDDLYVVAALLADLDRVLNPLPLEERGDLSAAPTIPPPLPPVAPRDRSRPAGAGAPPRRTPSLVALPPAPRPRPIGVAPPARAEERATRAAPAQPADVAAPASEHGDAGPAAPAIAAAPRPTGAPSDEIHELPAERPAAEVPAPAPAPRPFRGVAPPDPPPPGRVVETTRVSPARPSMTTPAAIAAPASVDAIRGPQLPASPPPGRTHHAAPVAVPPTPVPPAAAAPPAAPRSSGASRERVGSRHARDRQRSTSTSTSETPQRREPPALPRRPGNLHPGRSADAARSPQRVEGPVDAAARDGAMRDVSGHPANVTGPFVRDDDGEDERPSSMMLDDDVEGDLPADVAPSSGSVAHFWLRGGRLRITGSATALARAERRLAARWSLRRGRRL